MTYLFGPLQVPVPAPDDPENQAAGDPFLDTLTSFLQAALNADLQGLWARIHPGVVGPIGEPVPISAVFTHDPDESSFSDSKLPALYAWRSEEPRHVDWSQEWSKSISTVSVLWIPPLAQQEHRRIRQPFRNAYAKALHKNLWLGRNTAWVVDGDTEAKAADYGSLFIRHAQVMQYWLRGVQPHVLNIEHYGTKQVDPYECILASIEVHEVMGSLLDDVAAIANVRGTISVGMDADGLNELDVLAYQFQPALTSVSPISGSTAGGTPVTIKGRQFFADADGNAPTVTTTDGVALRQVVLVDEGVVTAQMPPHGAGVVGLVMTMPNGSVLDPLPTSFTYA